MDILSYLDYNRNSLSDIKVFLTQKLIYVIYTNDDNIHVIKLNRTWNWDAVLLSVLKHFRLSNHNIYDSR